MILLTLVSIMASVSLGALILSVHFLRRTREHQDRVLKSQRDSIATLEEAKRYCQRARGDFSSPLRIDPLKMARGEQG